jgi:hypothetical protein
MHAISQCNIARQVQGWRHRIGPQIDRQLWRSLGTGSQDSGGMVEQGAWDGRRSADREARGVGGWPRRALKKVGEEPGWQVVLSWVRRLQGAHEAHAFGSSFTLQYEILTPRRINSTLFACPVPRTRLPSWHCRIPRKAGVLYRPRVRDIPVQPQKRRVKRRRLEELRSCIEAVFPCVPQSQTPTAQWKDHSPSLFATQPLVHQTWVICLPYLAGCLPDRAMVKLHLGLPLSLLAPAEHANRQISESERTRGIVSWVLVSCQDLLVHAHMRLCLLMLWLVGWAESYQLPNPA